jgi:1-acyl-sn-glycerol-3-phosphate acyltransferase
MRALRGLAFAILAAVFTVLAFVTASAAFVLDPRRVRLASRVESLWGHAMLAAAGARLRVVNGERLAPSEPRVIVSNHASYLDIPAAFAAFPGPLRMVARRTLAWLPFAGWYVAFAHFFLDRDDPRQAMALMERVARRMRRDRLSPLLFAEGTRSADGRLAALKPGAFLLPLTAGVPVQPIAIVGCHDVLPKRAWAPRRGGTIEVRVGDPIPTAGLAGGPARKALAADVRRAILGLGAPGDA